MLTKITKIVTFIVILISSHPQFIIPPIVISFSPPFCPPMLKMLVMFGVGDDYNDVVHHQAGDADDDDDDDDNARQSLKSQWGRRHNTSIS